MSKFRTRLLADKAKPEPRNGDVVLTRIKRKVTPKRFQRLSAEMMEPQPVSRNLEDEAIEIGVIVGTVMGAIVVTRRAAC